MSPKSPSPRSASEGTAPQWIGALAMLFLTAGTVVLISYLIFDLPFQVQYGNWNYVVGAGLTVAMALPLRLWKPYDGARTDMSAADASVFDTSQVESPI